MTPVIAIVGRPNVGKSTLFNQMTRSRKALVADIPGLTRDRQYGEGEIEGKRFIVIDTGGIGESEDGIDKIMLAQSKQAIAEADIILFLVDGRAGRTAGDEIITTELRRLQKTIHLVVNKTDGLDPQTAVSDFYPLGLNEPIPIAATHGRGVTALIEKVLAETEVSTEVEIPQAKAGIKVAIVGRPNVGKSTLVNRMLGEERVIVFDQPGTTRDSIYIPMERLGKQYTLIDTAGVRKRGRIKETIEKFSIIKALQAIEAANVVIFMIEAREGVVEQDLNLLGFVLDSGKALVIAVNKWDGMNVDEKLSVKNELNRRLHFVDFAKLHFISALHGSDVGNLFPSVDQAYASAILKITTPEANRILKQAVETFPPPISHGHRIKLRYAHMGGQNPPIIVIHGNQTEDLAESYKRYLVNTYRKALNLVGTPIHIQLKSSENPFAGKRNKLTPRQRYKRKRLLKHDRSSK